MFVLTNLATQIKGSIEKRTHTPSLAKNLTKKIPRFDVQERFLVWLTLLVCICIIDLHIYL